MKSSGLLREAHLPFMPGRSSVLGFHFRSGIMEASVAKMQRRKVSKKNTISQKIWQIFSSSLFSRLPVDPTEADLSEVLLH